MKVFLRLADSSSRQFLVAFEALLTKDSYTSEALILIQVSDAQGFRLWVSFVTRVLSDLEVRRFLGFWGIWEFPKIGDPHIVP